MQLDDYFEEKKGTGVLSTADASGRVNAALYGRPHFIDGQTLAFIMADRLSHANLQTNGHAVYLFREEGERYAGKRLYLTKTRETDDPTIIDTIRSGPPHGNQTDGARDKKYVVYFQIDRVLPLIGDSVE